MHKSKENNGPKWSVERYQTGMEHKWSVLVVELVHLLGLFLSHSRYAKSVLATDVLFNQLLRHVDLISGITEGDTCLNIRQTDTAHQNRHFPPYLVQCGPVHIHGRFGWRTATDPSSDMMRALEQAFGCLAEQGIYSLKLHFADRSKTQNEKLRLALNIVARFHQAVDNNASITFRYNGRALTIPLIRDRKGQADPNLTVMAGLNGLTETNTRKLIKQAESFYALQSEVLHADAPVSTYERLFGLRSLRAQLIRPSVEINLSPWLETPRDSFENEADGKGFHTTAINSGDEKQHRPIPKDCLLTEVIETGYSLKSLSACLDTQDKVGQQQLSKVFSTDFTKISPRSLAAVLSDISSLLQHFERQQGSHKTSCDALLKFLSERIDRIPDETVEKMTIHRQSICLSADQQNIVIGMMHPRLIDLVTLNKERVLTRRKFVAMQALGFDFDNSNIASLAEKFEINKAEVEHVLTILKACFTDGHHFNLMDLKIQFQTAAQQADTLFEMLWCYLKQTELGPERLDLLTAIALCGQYLKDVKHTLRFLLADIYHDPFDVNFSDRNAFLLVNALLMSDVLRMDTRFNRTQGNLIKKINETKKQNQDYAAWRIDADQVRVLTKQRTLDDLFVKSLMRQAVRNEAPLDSSFLLALEREALLFFAACGGQTACIILRDALMKLGNPSGDVYHSKPTLNNLRKILDNLQIAVRGIGRFGEQKDLNLLKELERSANYFKSLYADSALVRQVNDMMDKISMTVKAIQMRL